MSKFPKGTKAWAVLRNPFSDPLLPCTLEPKTAYTSWLTKFPLTAARLPL